MPIDYTHFDEIGDDAPVPQKRVRKKPHAGPEVVREDFEDDISAYLDGGLPMPPPPPLTDEEKRELLRKSKLKFQAAKDEFGAEATAWHREQLKLAARDRCVYGPGAPGAPCDGGRARVRGGEDLSTWDAAARAAQTKKPAPGPESLDMKALREQAATGDAEAQYRLGARLYEDKKGAEAERFLKLAAAQHHAQACVALGEAYAAPVDDQIRLDLQEALKYFRKAARAGHAAARRRAAFLDDVFREAEAEGPEAPIFDDDDAAAKNDAAAAARAAHDARMALEGPAAPGIDRGAIREATEALRALGMSSAELRERS
ncbi:unnamed protein product [Pelagomonas calceolata]|uniref:Uncharacterized protein n=1 Tax=Pelagomonas calceolata TaxID=35677 RepID=A0A8J2SCT8_9STRA|nr:unnamed protein product [Pelagomonas calceolata]